VLYKVRVVVLSRIVASEFEHVYASAKSYL
jgi:hypothetical protein